MSKRPVYAYCVCRVLWAVCYVYEYNFCCAFSLCFFNPSSGAAAIVLDTRSLLLLVCVSIKHSFFLFFHSFFIFHSLFTGSFFGYHKRSSPIQNSVCDLLWRGSLRYFCLCVVFCLYFFEIHVANFELSSRQKCFDCSFLNIEVDLI